MSSMGGQGHVAEGRDQLRALLCLPAYADVQRPHRAGEQGGFIADVRPPGIQQAIDADIPGEDSDGRAVDHGGLRQTDGGAAGQRRGGGGLPGRLTAGCRIGHIAENTQPKSSPDVRLG